MKIEKTIADIALEFGARCKLEAQTKDCVDCGEQPITEFSTRLGKLRNDGTRKAYINYRCKRCAYEKTIADIALKFGARCKLEAQTKDCVDCGEQPITEFSTRLGKLRNDGTRKAYINYRCKRCAYEKTIADIALKFGARCKLEAQTKDCVDCGPKPITAFTHRKRQRANGKVSVDIDRRCKKCAYAFKKRKIEDEGEVLVGQGKQRRIEHIGPKQGTPERLFFCQVPPVPMAVEIVRARAYE